MVAALVAEGASDSAPNTGELSLAKQVLLADPDLRFDPYAVLVRFKACATAEERDEAIAKVGGCVQRTFELVPGLVKIEIVGSVENAIDTLSPLNSIEYAEPDFVVRPDSVIPNDPNFNQLWGMRNTGQMVNSDPGVAGADTRSTEAWGVRTGDANFVVAIIDSGTNLSHPDLAANLWTNSGEIAGNGVDDDLNGYVDDTKGWDFFGHDNNPSDGGHGTHTAGIVGAVGNNGIGVTGVAWSCKLMVLRFIGPTGGFTSDAILAIQYAVRKNVRVSNNSWGGSSFSNSLHDAIHEAADSNHLFVTSAGNSGLNNDVTPYYPAAYNSSNIISVASTDNNDARAASSNYGYISCDLGAPGVNIYSTYGSSYSFMSGTSMASPHVAGTAALVFIQNPSWSYLEVKARILATVRPIPSLQGAWQSGGILNTAAALGVAAPPPNTAPVVTITAPTANGSFVEGAAVTFCGSAADAEDGSRTDHMTWTSNLQGQFGVGGVFSVTTLRVGTHVITATAADTAGLSASQTRTITITALSVPIAPISPSVTRSGTTANVAWRDRSNNETGFQIRRERRIGGLWTGQIIVGIVGANVQSYANTGLTAGTYRYSIRAVNGSSTSAWTTWVSVSIP